VQADINTIADPLLELAEVGRHRMTSSSIKRVLDVVLSVVGIVGTLPLWLVIAVAIKLDSPGPIIFVQERIGQDGRPFRFLKFRSMHLDAESRLDGLRASNEVDGPVFKMRNDPRVTRVGRLIRRTSLDELPQLLNVLLGEMSLVGPRPALAFEVRHYRPEDRIRLSVKPGLTCLWVLRGRSNCNFDRWMEYDREYIRRSSLWLDLTILVRTIWIVLGGHGAY
jgi:lipopolysaccharide/colanic/teichoic acid biosynthesis glycosyltransferase